MAEILVIYDSRTGNTEKMAFAIAEGANQIGVEVNVRKVDDTSVQDLLNADGIVMGSPTYYGQMSAKLKALIDKSVKIHGKLRGKVGAAFTSSGGIASGAETTLLSIIEAMLIHGMIVQGRTHEGHYGAAAVDSPNKRELEACQDLGKSVTDLVQKLKL